MSQKQHNPPLSPPPPAYGDGSQLSSPSPAHVVPHSNNGSEYYAASPYQQPNQYGPPAQYNQGYPPQNQGYPPQNQGYPPQGQYNGYPQSNGYYAPGPQMQQGGYYGQQNMAYGQQGPYGPQGGYYQQQNRGMGAGEGFLGACLGALACCCCLDCLLF